MRERLLTQDETDAFRWSDRVHLARFGSMIALGACAGAAAWLAGLPLPFMLGGVLTTIAMSVRMAARGGTLPYPTPLRLFFVGVIGAMIGSTFSPALVSALPGLALTMAGMLVYVALSHAGGFAICRRFGGYDRATAFYSAMPGGLVEALELGARSGGDLGVLATTHFLRVLAVVVTIPLAFWLLSGEAVGSAAGRGFAAAPANAVDICLIAVLTLAGLQAGRRLRVPAPHLMGPMLVSAAAHGAGIIDTSSPTWLLFLAQLFVGVGLGAQFSRTKRSGLGRIIATTAVMITYMLALSLAGALILAGPAGLGAAAIFLSFAPGGVTEMGLIALSLSASPVVVAAHHFFRIFVTVMIAAWSARFFDPGADRP